MLTEICVLASGNRARSASKVEVQSRVLSPRIYDPLRVSAVPEVARMLLFRRERSSNGS